MDDIRFTFSIHVIALKGAYSRWPYSLPSAHARLNPTPQIGSNQGTIRGIGEI
jgi:hypothetical protein